MRLLAGERVEGDLFVDCSGFQSVLMQKALGDPFESWNSYLLCDRAVAFKIPAEGSVPPYTNSHALLAGWAWPIPLASHLGLGHVYSSQFTVHSSQFTVHSSILMKLPRRNCGSTRNSIQVRDRNLAY